MKERVMVGDHTLSPRPFEEISLNHTALDRKVFVVSYSR